MATKKVTAQPNGDATLGTRMEALELRVEALEAGRPGRKAKPMVAIRQQGVCAIDPSRDSATCEDASIFRYQIGCHGDKCRAKQHDAYERRKAKKASVSPKKKAAPVKKAVSKKTAVATPAKRVAKKVAAATA